LNKLIARRASSSGCLLVPVLNGFVTLHSKELVMIKLVGWIALIWFLFHFGIAQALLIWMAVLGTTIFG
jgi:hypothetical protein